MLSSRITGRKVDYSSMTKLPNVDTMCDVLTATQIELGQSPQLQEAEYDRSGNKIRRFKRHSDGKVVDTRTGEIIENTSDERDMPIVSGDSDSKKIRIVSDSKPKDSVKKSCPTKKKETKRKSLFDRSFREFYDGYFDDDDDEDEDYICEYCTELGYSGKYKPHVCDSCTKCESCMEFQNGTCDGCTYSRVRTGQPYSDSLTVDQIVDRDDLDILENLDDSCSRKRTGNFSTLNY